MSDELDTVRDTLEGRDVDSGLECEDCPLCVRRDALIGDCIALRSAVELDLPECVALISTRGGILTVLDARGLEDAAG